MNAAVLFEAGAALQIGDVEVPDLAEDEVRVRLA